MGVIYGLCDPDTGEIRYVGKTVGIAKDRLKGHLKASRTGKAHLHKWVRSLKGRSPTVTILDRGPARWLDDLERWWIAYCRRMGYRLTNHTDGGDGGPMDEATRRRIASTVSEYFQDPANRLQKSKAGRRRFERPGERERLYAREPERLKAERSATNLKRFRDPAAREAMRTKMLAAWAPGGARRLTQERAVRGAR
jgi:hypothetical protein